MSFRRDKAIWEEIIFPSIHNIHLEIFVLLDFQIIGKTQNRNRPLRKLHMLFVLTVDWAGTEDLHMTQFKQSMPERALFLIREVSVKPRIQGASCWKACTPLPLYVRSPQLYNREQWRLIFRSPDIIFVYQTNFCHMQCFTWRISVCLPRWNSNLFGLGLIDNWCDS